MQLEPIRLQGGGIAGAQGRAEIEISSDARRGRRECQFTQIPIPVRRISETRGSCTAAADGRRPIPQRDASHFAPVDLPAGGMSRTRAASCDDAELIVNLLLCDGKLDVGDLVRVDGYVLR